MSVVTVWDGQSIRFEDSVKAEEDASFGYIQIWRGALNTLGGWYPGFYMKYKNQLTPRPIDPEPDPGGDSGDGDGDDDGGDDGSHCGHDD